MNLFASFERLFVHIIQELLTARVILREPVLVANDGSFVHVAIFVEDNLFETFHQTTLLAISSKSRFKTFRALITQRPRVLLADGRIERNQNIIQRNALFVV